MEWSTLGHSGGNTPAHLYSLKGGPAEKALPTNPHNLSLNLSLNLTVQLPAFSTQDKVYSYEKNS